MRRAKNVWMALGLVLGLAMAAQAEWFYSSCGNTRYDPCTGVAQYMSEGWVNDSHPETNPAYLEFQAVGGSCSGGTSARSYNNALGDAENAHKTMRNDQVTQWYDDIDDDDECCACNCYDYEESEVPEWSYRFFGGVDYDKVDYAINAGRTYMDTDVTTLQLGGTARKERLSLTGAFRYEFANGDGAFAGDDSQTAGLLFLPGFRVLSEDEQFVNLTLYGILDVSYVFMDNADNQTRFMPGAGAMLSRSTPIGIFLAGYSFEYSRNFSGDIELSGNHHLDTHNGSADYVLPITKNIYAGCGLLYTYVSSMPNAVDHDFLEAHVSAGAVQVANWDFSLEYAFAADSTDNQSIRFMAGYQW